MTRRLALLVALAFACTSESTPITSDAGADAMAPVDAQVADTSADAALGGDAAADAMVSDAMANNVATPSEPRRLVSTEWLAAHLTGSNIQLVATASPTSRLPGAAFVDPTSLRATVDGVRDQVAPNGQIQAAFRAAGVRSDATVVVYGAQSDASSARVLWTFDYVGHQSVYYLDGGLAKWVAEGRMTAAPGPVTPTDYTITRNDEVINADRDDVVMHIPVGDAGMGRPIVDVRGSGEYLPGHIRSARNLDWTTLVASGSFKSASEMLSLFAAAGVTDRSQPVIVYCQSGTRASAGYLALSELGFNVRLYDGSWNEWSTLNPNQYPREP